MRATLSAVTFAPIQTDASRSLTIVYEPEGREPESLRARHFSRDLRKDTILENCLWLADTTNGQIVDAISIGERPAEIKDRSIPGHWEGDLIGGTKNSHIATLVERHSRFVMLVKVPSKDTATVVAGLSQHIYKLPATLRRSLTWDRGLEMAQHKSFTVDTEVKVYFCDPQSPWQRGSNENTNGLLRQYFPKRTDLSAHSQEKLDEAVLLLNQRPKGNRFCLER